jgi:drug/metabolite transporter (DMT)-like permease
MLPLGIIHLLYGWLLFYLFPLSGSIGVWPILVAIISSILRTGAVTIMLYSLKRVDVSRVVPVVFAYPIIVAIIAVPLFGETLDYWQWLAIIIVVIGAIMASVRQGPFGTTVWLGKPFLLLFGSSLLLALTDLTSKYALAYISAWNMFSVTALCIAGIFLPVSLCPGVFSQLSNMKRRNSTFALLAFGEALVPVASMLSFWALERGPVSLVSTILSSRPIFVVMSALILSRVLPTFLEWQPGRGLLVLRLIATVMIFGGVAIIYLS